MKKRLFLLLLAGLAAGCVKVHTKVEPIEINVNVRVKVDRELDQFFNDLDQADPTLAPAPTAPAESTP